MKYPIYMDYNATTPLDKEVLEAMLPYLTDHFGNAASRFHAYGWKAAEAVDLARQQVAGLLGASEKEIVFTSGATESVNLAIKGVYEAFSRKGNHIITVATEHKAVLDTCQHLEKSGAEITYLPVDSEGNIDLTLLEASIRPTTILISVMAANNEIGVTYPLKTITEIAHRHQVLFHTDATQAVGKLLIDVIADEIDLLSMSAHKLYGPKGVGALYIRKKLNIVAQQDGGKHERGLRSGTLNVPGIVGLGKACEICQQRMTREAIRLGALRDSLENGILGAIPETKINGNITYRLPNTSNICFGRIDGEQLLMSLNEIAVSNGSACNSASTEPSYVLKALGLDDDSAYGSIRFSLGRMTKPEDIDFAIKHIIEVVNRMQKVRVF
ncbi:cysteine desulfurase family protein [Emticicia sp. C21]|uniref:cysteine desulfurase family protein n=1 Tax=Emticicia sp. C21 TaxID=2302915 RepID=UPI000E354E4B|nr:IscS subfamily cysteine desulfurase [Emticicia sp. C21]RFS17418.1 aminotransferase class V-fold PLP-dependent enzyme [Emticicia sp. C21]